MTELMQSPLKRSVIKEELVALTGDYMKAIILNQFIYWSERVNDFDRFVVEERQRIENEGLSLNMQPTNGWIYKSAEELIEETMLGISAATIGRHIQVLVDKGYLLWRHNPEHRWDRTKQYRVDFVKTREGLADLGYVLEGYAFFKMKNATFIVKDAFPKMKVRDFNLKNGNFNMKNRIFKSEKAIPEITTEITTNNNIVDDITDGHHKNLTRENTRTHLNKTPTTEAPLDPYSQMISRMSKHMGHDYVPSANDYHAINQLLVSDVPTEFILSGIDLAFANSRNREINSFVYCAKIIVQNWALELAKQSEVNPIDWGKLLKQSEHKVSSFETSQGKDWSLFEELFEKRNSGSVNS